MMSQEWLQAKSGDKGLCLPEKAFSWVLERQQAFRINTDGLWKRPANKSKELCDREVKDYDEESFKNKQRNLDLIQ